MAILKSFSSYIKVLDVEDTYWMIQVDLSNQYIKNIEAVFVQKPSPTFDNLSLEKSDDIEVSFNEMVTNSTHTAMFQYKNEILHIIGSQNYIDYTTDQFYFTSTRLATPIETLDDPIDIPNTLVPLFVQKVLANTYQLQGKETPLPIKRRIKELE